MATIESEDGVSAEYDDDEDPLGGDDGDEGEEDIRAITVRTAWLDEKAAAVFCLGNMAEAMGARYSSVAAEVAEAAAASATLTAAAHRRRRARSRRCCQQRRQGAAKEEYSSGSRRQMRRLRESFTRIVGRVCV